jgi:putative FmdB family regulatory protein
MPIYEYQCEKCQETLEISQKISEGPLTTCPKCGGDLRKLISRTSFQLKGGGWYQTDYKKKPSEPAASGSDSTTAAPAAKPEKPKGGCGSGGCGHNH